MDQFISTLLLGIVSGSVYALASTGLVLTYKTSGILNLGYGALAVFTTYIYRQFSDVYGIPVWASALLVVLVIAPAIGLFLDAALFRRLEGQPPIIGLIATVGLFVLLRGIVQLVWDAQTYPVQSVIATYWQGDPLRLPGGAFISRDSLGILLVAAGSAGALGAFLRYTKVGVAFRAVVNNRPVAGLMGINTSFVSGFAWALSTAFAALVGILLSPSLLLDPNLLPPLIIAFVLGAAVVGYLQSLPLAWVGGIGLGVGQAMLIRYGGDEPVIGALSLSKLSDALPFVMITVAVLMAPRALRAGGFGASFIVRTREVVSEAGPSLRTAVGGAVFLGVGLVPLLSSSTSWQLALIQGMTNAIIYLSLVILTGYSGQISLGHTAFMGIAVFTGAHLVADLGWPVWVAMPLGACAAAGAGALVGLIAVRLHGLFLALMTLAFAFMIQTLAFDDPGISGGEGGVAVPRPPGFTSDTGLYYLCLGALIAGVLLAMSLRTGRTGRVLASMRDSETGTRSLGISVTRYKVLIFGLSASIAGAGAILQMMLPQQAHVRSFIPFNSLILVAVSVLGGIFHAGGAIAVGVVFGLLPKIWPGISEYNLILFGLGSTLALANDPEGMFGSMRRGANGALRLLKRRRPPRAQPAPVTGGQR